MGELLPKKRRRVGWWCFRLDCLMLGPFVSDVSAQASLSIATNIYLARASDTADKSPKTNKEEPRWPEAGIEESSRINRYCGHQA
jgi:hypothetical protein